MGAAGRREARVTREAVAAACDENKGRAYCSDVADAAAIVKVFHAVEGRTALDAMKELRAMDNKHKVMREAAKAESEEIRARLRIVEFEWDRFLKQQLGDLPKGEDFRRLGDKMAATRSA